jgi:predicted  nucleic acid-binding Zn-ribbon protein
MNIDVKRLQQKIEDLEAQLERAKTEKAQIEGKLDSLKEQLKKQFGVASLKEAEVEHKKMVKEIADLGEEQSQVVADLDKVLTTVP